VPSQREPPRHRVHQVESGGAGPRAHRREPRCHVDAGGLGGASDAGAGTAVRPRVPRARAAHGRAVHLVRRMEPGPPLAGRACAAVRLRGCRRGTGSDSSMTIQEMTREAAPIGGAVVDDPLWYKDVIIYELHVRAFFDSNGDGIGDFRGLTQKLDYLQQLGVTALWLLPFYPSPLRDGGYDISDYTSINPDYGTMADFMRFVREAHR